MKVSDLKREEYNDYYQEYIDTIPKEEDLRDVLRNNRTQFLEFLDTLQKENLSLSYAEGKWTIAELLQHILDVERVFQYRALRFARKDKTPLPGFDHDAYVKASNALNRNLKNFIIEFEAVRNSTLYLYNSFNDEMLKADGFIEDSKTSVRAIAFILAGHVNHHMSVLQERYL